MQSGSSYSTASSGSAHNSIPLPAAVDMVRPYAMADLGRIIARARRFQAGYGLVAGLKTHGVRNPKPLLKLGGDRMNGFAAAAELLKEDPNNESLLALNVLAGLQRSRGERAGDVARPTKSFARSGPSWP